MTPTEIQQTIDRLRRDMPRNHLAMALCDAAEQLMVKPVTKPKMTRAEIQKNYRARRRAEGKAK